MFLDTFRFPQFLPKINGHRDTVAKRAEAAAVFQAISLKFRSYLKCVLKHKNYH
jgi:hypothetical protein